MPQSIPQTVQCAIRGKIRASSHTTRDIKTKLSYIRHIMQGNNTLLKTIFEDIMETSKDPWIKMVKTYMLEINTNVNKIREMRKEEISNKINDWDTECWETELKTKHTLAIYRKYKN